MTQPDPLAQFRTTGPVEEDDADPNQVACGCKLAMAFYLFGAITGHFVWEGIASLLR
jgi:hypothetical protein